MVKNNSPISSVDDLNGKKVAVQLGTVADLVLSEEYPEVEVVQHKKFLVAVEDLLANKVDAIVFDLLPAEEVVNENNELKILELNSGIMMENFSSESEENYKIAEKIYGEAINYMFNN